MFAMTKMSTEKMRLYQRERRARIRGGEAVATVAGVLSLVRGLEERVDKLEDEVTFLETERVGGER